MKNRRSLNSYKNNRKYVGPSPFFLIVCKGEITEPDYFRSFPYYSKLGNLIYMASGIVVVQYT